MVHSYREWSCEPNTHSNCLSDITHEQNASYEAIDQHPPLSINSFKCRLAVLYKTTLKLGRILSMSDISGRQCTFGWESEDERSEGALALVHSETRFTLGVSSSPAKVHHFLNVSELVSRLHRISKTLSSLSSDDLNSMYGEIRFATASASPHGRRMPSHPN